MKALAEIAAAGADSLIVQDVAVAQLAHQIAPDLAIHGSTQMSITSAEGIALAQQFGVSRVVLARELSLDEVRAIRAATSCELEMFVHGALRFCILANVSRLRRGRAQRQPRKMRPGVPPAVRAIVDDQLKPLGDARYLLSPGDLYALHQIPDIVEIGISALKIEGRLKDANHVALTTQAYRQAVDGVARPFPPNLPHRRTPAHPGVLARAWRAFCVGDQSSGGGERPFTQPSRRQSRRGTAGTNRQRSGAARTRCRHRPHQARRLASSSMPPTGAARPSRKKVALCMRWRRKILTQRRKAAKGRKKICANLRNLRI
ncbi:MAG: U32 family peptidase [Chloroflexota bacterium]